MNQETENAIQAQAKRCSDEIRKAMKMKPKPNWNETVPPILKKHQEMMRPLGVTLLEFVGKIGRMNGRFGVES